MAKSIIIDDLNNKTKLIETKDYSIVKIKDLTRNVRIEEILPFRVKFTAIQIVAIGLGNTPAIPLQVIGYSNYIL
jgi:hypothetical protein